MIPESLQAHAEGKLILSFDTETSSFDGSIIEIAFVTHDYQVFESRIKPPAGERIHPKAYAAHGISLADLRDSPTWEEVALKCKTFITEQMRRTNTTEILLVAYNAMFDHKRLVYEEKRTGVSFLPCGVKTNILCALKLAKAKKNMFLDTLEPCERGSFDLKLKTVYFRLLGRSLENAHSAKADAVAVARILLTGVLTTNMDATLITLYGDIRSQARRRRA